MLKALNAISDCIDKLLQAALMVLSVVMVVVNLAQVAGRYLFSYSLPWSEELSTYMYVWIIFLSLHMIARDRSELTIDVLRFKKSGAQFALTLFRDLVSILTVAALLAASILMIRNSMSFPQKTASLHVSTYIMYLCMPASFALVILQKITNIIGLIVKSRPGCKNDPTGAV